MTRATHIAHRATRQRWLGILASWLGILAIMGACTQRYALDYALSTRTLTTENQESDLKFPPANAIELLTEVKTVAFAPPDECIEAANGKDIARQRCGEVMTALEQAAIEAGLQVVSWQAFRGNEPALNYARRNNVDILFEINRLGPDNALSDYTLTGSLNFFTMTDDNQRQKVAVSSRTRRRCTNYIVGGYIERATQNSVVLDVKMISVKTGLVVWNYRRLFLGSVIPTSSKGTEYFQGLRGTDPILCIKSASFDNITDDTTDKDPMLNRWNFQHTVTGRESSSAVLRRVSQLAANEFIELLVYLQAVSPSEKRVTLRVPARPKEVQGITSSGCETLAGWLRAGILKIPPAEYSRNCRK